MLKQRRILLTGASGWFGRSFISEFIKHNGVENIGQLTLVTSDGRELTHPLLRFTLKSITFDDACKFSDYDTIIQSSFLTRDKIQLLGAEKYSQQCQHIIDHVSDIIGKNPQSKVFLISSGAVYTDQSLYGKYKRIEEDVIQSTGLGDTKIFRIFGATTKYMDFRKWSAVCNFIKAAKQNQDIRINSDREILRGMVCMEDLSTLIIKIIGSKNKTPHHKMVCDAVSDISSIRNLAKLSLGTRNKIILPKNFNSSLIDNSYTGNPAIFKKLALKYDVDLKSSEQQIRHSINNFYSKSYN